MINTDDMKHVKGIPGDIEDVVYFHVRFDVWRDKQDLSWLVKDRVGIGRKINTMTYCVIFYGDNTHSIGWARCVKGDQFNRKIGRKISVGRGIMDRNLGGWSETPQHVGNSRKARHAYAKDAVRKCLAYIQ